MAFRIRQLYNKNMEKNCLNCGKLFEKQPSDSRRYWDKKKFCSIVCSGTLIKKGQHLSSSTELKKGCFGNKNPNYKGGKSIDGHGYIRIWIGDKRKHIQEHRLIMEKYIGRKLKKSEHVHHINGVKTDNRIENLTILDIREHGYLHTMQRWHPEGF